jgi:hypothetical protein
MSQRFDFTTFQTGDQFTIECESVAGGISEFSASGYIAVSGAMPTVVWRMDGMEEIEYAQWLGVIEVGAAPFTPGILRKEMDLVYIQMSNLARMPFHPRMTGGIAKFRLWRGTNLIFDFDE